MLKVTKFGGSSVAGSEQFKKVKAIVESDEARKIVIVSAAGKRDSSDHKLTDLLYLCDAHLTYGVSCADILAEIRERLTGIASDLGLSYDVGAEFDAFSARLKKGFPVDELVSRGEYFTAKLMAEFLGYAFVDASECIFFTYEGILDKEKTYFAVSNAVEKYGRVLIPGFYGTLPTGKIRVMSRGGSDITGAVAAAATHADVYENWTDVSGILMADPRIVKDPKPIPKITYSPNVVQAKASVLYMVRANKVADTVKLQKRVDDIAKGAALMTGTTFERVFIDGTAELVPNFTIEKALYRNLSEIGVPAYDPEDYELAAALKATYNGNELKGFKAAGVDQEYMKIVTELTENGTKPVNDFLPPLFSSTAFTPGSTDVGDVSWLTPITMPAKMKRSRFCLSVQLMPRSIPKRKISAV